MPKRKKFTIEEIKFLKDFYSLHGALYCSKILKRSKISLITKANRLGLKLFPETLKTINQEQVIKIRQLPAPKVNINFFTTNITKESSYILGLLWADGNIHKTNNQIRISCLKEDLENCIPTFNTTGKWNTYTIKRKPYREQLLLTTSNRFLKQHLLNLNFKVNPDKIIKIISNKHLSYFLRGVIDGDGCWYLSKDNRQRKFTLTGPYSQDWKWFISILKTHNIQYNIRFQILNGSRSQINITSRKNLKKLGKLLYPNNIFDNIGFTRKYYKWKKIMDSYKNIPSTYPKEQLHQTL